MNKNKAVGIGLIIIALVIVGAFIIKNNHKSISAKNDNKEIVSSTYIQNIYTNSEISTNNDDVEVTTESNTEKITLSNQKEIEFIEKIKIKDVNDEVLQILECDSDKLYKVIQTFANGYGYASAQRAVYAGICTINHIEDTKEATFYFYMKDKKIIYFDVILNRKSKKIFCELK